MSEIVRRATRADEREITAALLSEIQNFRATTTEFASRYFSQAVNKVLGVETVIFPTAGYVTRSYAATAGAVEVRNLDGSNAVTLVVGGASGTAPASGVGVYVVPAATVQVVNIASTTFTLYGTAASKVSIQVFADGGRDGGS